MKTETNIFGTGKLFTAEDLKGSIYVLCCACMSIYSEFLSWANRHPGRFVESPKIADNIIVLSCQVTDLAVYNDLSNLKELMKYKEKKYFVGGCLARRFDIPLPKGVDRLDNIKSDYQRIANKYLISYAPPFWVKNIDHSNEYNDGMLFRNMYPLRVGVGCTKKCTYCTIRTTRGEAYQLDPVIFEDEFLQNDNIVVIADSLSHRQIVEITNMAILNGKPVSFRNLEPQVAYATNEILELLAASKLLKILHVPIQSDNPDVLFNMGRSSVHTLKYMEFAKKLSDMGVFTATNIIIDYKNFPNPDMEKLNSIFNYISWNPYWSGKWDFESAKNRYEKYILNNYTL